MTPIAQPVGPATPWMTEWWNRILEDIGDGRIFDARQPELPLPPVEGEDEQS